MLTLQNLYHCRSCAVILRTVMALACAQPLNSSAPGPGEKFTATGGLPGGAWGKPSRGGIRTLGNVCMYLNTEYSVLRRQSRRQAKAPRPHVDSPHPMLLPQAVRTEYWKVASGLLEPHELYKHCPIEQRFYNRSSRKQSASTSSMPYL